MFSYDANGNNLGNTFKGSTRTMTWDEENRLKEVKDSSTSRGKYLYSPDGERTHKLTCAGDTYYVNQFYVFQPSKLATKHIFAGETRIVSKTENLCYQYPMISYYHPDHLGSTSYISGTDQSLLQHERYFPFGERDTGDREEIEQGRQDSIRREWLFNSKELDWDTGLYYYGARYYDPRTAVWQSADPALGKYMRGGEHTRGVFAPRNLGLYSYSWNNPVVLQDPDGREPVKATAGMPSAVRAALNNSPSHVGEQRGTAAQMALIRLGQTKNMAPENAGKIFGEQSQNVRYVYTEQGGWIDMEHFSFYAGVAHEKKVMSEAAPFAAAMRLGKLQELGDKSNSSFSYEDLPSDAAGAYFGAYVFDPKSSATLGQQVEQFLNGLGAAKPEDAPNWKWMPQTEEAAAAQGRPTLRNYSPTPLFTKDKDRR